MSTKASNEMAEREKIQLILGAVLTVIAPPIGILIIVWNMIMSRKRKKAEETKSPRPDWEKYRRDGRQENGKRDHSHTPVAYSYDSCAVDRRLEQLEVLYKAGLYTREQYREAKQKILRQQ